MNVLMIGNVASTGWNLVKGLEKKGINVVLVSDESIVTSGIYDYQLSWFDFLRKKYGKDYFDIIHIHSPNLKKLSIAYRYLNAKLVCHWHGSDLRIPRKAFPVYHLLKKISDYHLYSTIDLAWWLRKIDKDKKQLFLCPIDTSLFKPDGNKKQGLLTLSDGGKIGSPIYHDDMPKYMNNFDSLKVIPAYNLSERLLQVSMLEGAACDLNVLNHPWLNRKWVIDNASIDSQTEKLINIYNKVLEV